MTRAHLAPGMTAFVRQSTLMVAAQQRGYAPYVSPFFGCISREISAEIECHLA